MGRAYLHSTILTARANEIKEALDGFKTEPDFGRAIKLLEKTEEGLRIMAEDWRLPEELYNEIARKLNKKRMAEVSQAIKVLESWTNDMSEEFNEWWEDKDGDRQFSV